MQLIFIGGHKRQCQVFVLTIVLYYYRKKQRLFFNGTFFRWGSNRDWEAKNTDDQITISVDEYALIHFFKADLYGVNS